VELTIDREYDYTPEWKNNKGDANPIKFKMRMLTTGEHDKLMGYEFGIDGTVRLKPDRQGMFLAAVVKVENLKVNGESVTSAREMLARPGMDLLMAEVVTDVLGQNSREDLKN
jgi:hypothetical protein